MKMNKTSYILGGTAICAAILLFGDGVPLPPTVSTVPASPSGAKAAVGFEATVTVKPVNSLIAVGKIEWTGIYATDSLDYQAQSTILSIYSNVNQSNGHQKVILYGRESNDIVEDSTGTKRFQLTASNQTGDTASTIPFDIYTLKGINLISPPQGAIHPGDAIIDTTGVASVKSSTLRQDIYGIIAAGTTIVAGDYVCNLICKNYLSN